MKRGSSVRLTGVPRTSTAVVFSSTLCLRGDRRRGAGPHRPRRFADGGDEVLVAGTAAEVALDGVADLVVERIGVAREMVGGRHDHGRRADAAVEATVPPDR